MRQLTTSIPLPNITRWKVAKWVPFQDETTPYGVLYLQFQLAGGLIYGPEGKPGLWSVPLTDAANSVAGRFVKNAAPVGVADVILPASNSAVGVYSAIQAAVAGAGSNRNQQLLAIEAVLIPNGVLSADFAYS